MNHLSMSRSRLLLFYTVLIVMAVIQIYPFVWVMSSSLKTANQIATTPAYSFPTQFYLGNYLKAFQSSLPRYFLNSLVVAVMVLVLLVAFASLAAFAISKLQFPHAEKVMSFFLLGMMIPAFCCLIPMFSVYNFLKMRNTYWSLILPQLGFGLPMSIYLYRNFMQRIPMPLIEAAAIDGASPWYVFTRVVFPMSKNATVTILTYNFIGVWNEFTYANTFLTKQEMKTLPVGLTDFVGEMGAVDWGATFAAITITIVPTLIIYFFLNKQVMDGMVMGAVK